MKTLLVGINAKYIHSNLAIRLLREYARRHFQLELELAEFTINQYAEEILAELFRRSPECIGFSCYIWNYELIKRLCSELKKVLPNIQIFLGGPEVTFHPEEVLRTTEADFVLIGEGEQSCSLLVQALEQKLPYHQVPGLAYWENDQIIVTQQAAPLEMDDVPFVYEGMDLSNLEHRILYYESTRGCPFRCQYCLSGSGSKVRFTSLERVFQHLDFFLSHRVRQVKFVDRTFNCDKRYAMAIWKYLKEHDNGYTNFHFEIAAELLDEDTLDFLLTVRQGYFQFEIGVQSTNSLTLEHIQRRTDIQLLRKITAHLKKGKNIHLHLDLIIGLPYENYESFGHSFDDVYRLEPDQLQVGFLKLLRGSGLYQNQKKYGIVSSNYAPYEVLSTDALPYRDLLRLKGVEEMVEIYYNSNRFRHLIQLCCGKFERPFLFFEALADEYIRRGLHRMAHSNVEYYTILHDFFLSRFPELEEEFQWYAKFDLYSHEKAKKLPEWLTVSKNGHYKNAIFDFYDNPENISKYLPEYVGTETKQLIRQAHLEVFPYHPDTHQLGDTAVLFNYRNCDLLGNAAYSIVQLPQPQLRRKETQ